MPGPLRDYMKGFDYFKKTPLILMSPGEKTENFLVHTGECLFCGILVITDGTNTAKVIVYDNTAGNGTVKWECSVKGDEHYGGGMFPFPVEMDNGYYVVLTGTGASFIPFYVPVVAN